MTAVLKMPHWSNQHAASGRRYNSHEDALADELDRVGYQEQIQAQTVTTDKGKRKTVLTYPALGKNSLLRALKKLGADRQAAILALVPGMAAGTYIRQPSGSQSFPDFLIRDFSGTFVVVEAKSGSGVSPTWNDSLPKADCIYIMSSGKHAQTTCWLGQDWISDPEVQTFESLYKTIDNVVLRTNQLLKTMDQHRRGWQFYSRKKHQQTGTYHYTDPYRHQDRMKCEQNVLNFAKAQ